MKLAMLCLLLLGNAPANPPPAPRDAGSAVAETSVASVTSASGRLRVEVLASATPLRRGVQRFHIRVTEAATGRAVPGVELAVLPWMPSMGHGIDGNPRITVLGPGDFEVSDLDLFMPGAWELRLTLTGKVDDKAVVPLKLAR